MEIWNIIVNAYHSYANYFVSLLKQPISGNFLNPFYFLILVSLFVWMLEIIWPWREKQKVFRKDFWLDAFYMFFNYFFFNLLIFAALSSTTQHLFSDAMQLVGLPKGHVFNFMAGMPEWSRVLVFFLVYDFIQWGVHNSLHRVPLLWRFHKVHHSVQEMGFAAHLRYHFMENIFYRLALFISLSYVLKIDLPNIAWLYAATTLIGHLNHANFNWQYGPVKYVLNSQRFHIWHHAKELPNSHPKGMNFAITLSIWDYLFGTNYEPYDGRDIPLGFDNVEEFPNNFIDQQLEAFRKP
jgi:sterol desaturase/sphingolipid hydroxylase (fatty acid hydroxylase superfamily)